MRVTPFQASIATGLLTVGATWLGARINWTSQARREREAREAERRHVFEHETLISLQDALETVYQVLQEMVLVQRFPPDMDDDQVVDHPSFPEPLAYRTAVGEVEKLRERVLEYDLRMRIDLLLSGASGVMVATTRNAAEQRWDDFFDQFSHANEQIGERVRGLFRL
jgi:hypothetical protein